MYKSSAQFIFYYLGFIFIFITNLQATMSWFSNVDVQYYDTLYYQQWEILVRIKKFHKSKMLALESITPGSGKIKYWQMNVLTMGLN